MPGALVTLGDPIDHGFPELVERFRALPLARGVRVRLVPALYTRSTRPDATRRRKRDGEPRATRQARAGGDARGDG